MVINRVKKVDLTGKVLVPLGYAKYFVMNGNLHYDPGKANSKSSSVELFRYMSEDQFDIRDYFMLDTVGKTAKRGKMDVDGSLMLIANGKEIGYLGQNVPVGMVLETVLKMCAGSGLCK